MEQAEFLFQEDNPNLFWTEWRRFLSRVQASYRYLPTYMDYSTKYAKQIVADRSFIFFRGGGVAGICPLFVEEIEGVRSISSGGGFLSAPLSVDEKSEKVLFQKIDQIGADFNVSVTKIFLDPLLRETYGGYNRLRKYGYLDVSSSNAFVDLKQTEAVLWQNLRKSYKPLINGLLKNSEYRIEFYDQTNPDYAVHESYRLLHHKCSGRVTRPKETFDLQFKMLQEGNALLAGMRFRDDWIAFNYFAKTHNRAIYFSTSDDPDIVTPNSSVYHALLWKSYQRLKSEGIEMLELSQPTSHFEVEGFLDYSDKKQIDIGMYKRGMSSEMTSLFRGIKYRDFNLFQRDLEGFLSKMKSRG